MKKGRHWRRRRSGGDVEGLEGIRELDDSAGQGVEVATTDCRLLRATNAGSECLGHRAELDAWVFGRQGQ